MGPAKFVIGLRVIRIQSNGFAVCRDCSISLTAVAIGIAEFFERFGIVWSNPNCLKQRGNRLRIFVTLVTNPTETVMRFGKLRLQTQSLFVSVGGQLVFVGAEIFVALAVVPL